MEENGIWNKPKIGEEYPLTTLFKIPKQGKLEFEFEEKVFRIPGTTESSFQNIIEQSKKNSPQRLGTPTTVGGVRGLDKSEKK